MTTYTDEQVKQVMDAQKVDRIRAIHLIKRMQGDVAKAIAYAPAAKPAAKPKAAKKAKAKKGEHQGKYNQAKVVELYMEQGKTIREISESKLPGVVGISKIFVHRILMGSKNSGGVSPEQMARRREQKARMDAARLARRAADKKAAK